MNPTEPESPTPVGISKILPLGHVIDHYRVVQHLGAGRTAEVYAVADTRNAKEYALKLIHPRLSQAPGFVDRFREIGRSMLALRTDPLIGQSAGHIAAVFDCQASAACCYLVMEWVRGEDLGSYLGRCPGALDPQTARYIYQQVGEALMAAHRHGIIHGHLNPGHVFICSHQTDPRFVKVVDFGLGALCQQGPGGQAVPVAIPPARMAAYLAPEQAEHVRGRSSSADPRSDQFALGAIIYQMLIGRTAFFQPGDNTDQVLRRLVREDPVLFALPKQQQMALLRALSRTSEQRYPSVRDFLKAFDEVPEPPRPPSLLDQRLPPAVARPNLPPRWLAIGGGLLLLLFLSVTWTAMRRCWIATSRCQALGLRPPTPKVVPKVEIPPAPPPVSVAPEDTPPDPEPLPPPRAVSRKVGAFLKKGQPVKAPVALVAGKPPQDLQVKSSKKLNPAQFKALQGCAGQIIMAKFKVVVMPVRGKQGTLKAAGTPAAAQNQRFQDCLKRDVRTLPDDMQVIITRGGGK